MKKILFLINSLNGGGAEKTLVDLVNGMNENEYEITVFSLLDGGVHKQKLNANIK